jgi:transcriptional regulator with XRE-family HTH domain
MDNLKKEVGQRLKESRRAKNLTQLQVAKLLRMTQQQYSRFENGIYELDYAHIVYLCSLYEISSDYLFGLTEY